MNEESRERLALAQKLAPYYRARGRHVQLLASYGEEACWSDSYKVDGFAVDVLNVDVEATRRILADVLERADPSLSKQRHLATLLSALPLTGRGYQVMAGYYKMEDATAEAIDREGWLHTGDLATMDAQGYLNIVGRLKDMLIRGGENVYPREIEEFLHIYPKVSDVQVIGLPDARYGEEIAAWVKLKPGEEVTAEELKDFCKGKISHYKVPRYFKFVNEFPMTVTGKPQKFLMRRQSIEELSLQSAAAIQTA